MLKTSFVLVVTLCALLVACKGEFETEEATRTEVAVDNKKESSYQASNSSTEPKGPFGLAMGMRLNELKNSIPTLMKQDEFTYWSVGTIKPSPIFPMYIYRVTDETGLCMVAATSGDIPTNDFGDSLKLKYAEAKHLLVQKYGEPTEEVNFLQKGSIWNEPRDFTRALQKGDREIKTVWLSQADKPLPNALENITVGMKTSSSSVGLVLIAYHFNNHNDCMNRLNDRSKEGL